MVSMADARWSLVTVLLLLDLLLCNPGMVRVESSFLSPSNGIKPAVNSALAESPRQQVLTDRSERFPLFSLRSSLGLRNRDWPRRLDPCATWRGIQCEAGHVVDLNLSGLRRTLAGGLNPQFAVDSLQNLPFLRKFNASGFALPGSIPHWFGQLSALRVMDLSSTSITGSIPASLGSLAYLSVLVLSQNNLTGTIPSTLGQLTHLTFMDMSFNHLTGSIPLTFSNLLNLTVLSLSGNNLQGPIPSQLGNLSGLIHLNLGSNMLHGFIPRELGRLRDLNKLDLANNYLVGMIPEEIFKCTELRVLDLNYNNLSSSLPQSLGSLTNLLSLNLSYNNLTGSLPSTISRLVNIERIILSHNQFYGSLTPGLANLHHLTYMDLSDNYFEEKVPHGFFRVVVDGNCLQGASNQRKLKACTSFYDGKARSFSGFEVNISSNHSPSSHYLYRQGNRHLKPILGGALGGLALVLLVIVLISFVLKLERKVDRKEKDIHTSFHKEGPSSVGISINLLCLGEAFSYEKLRQATIEFSPSNLIKRGNSGDFYQGLLEGGIPIAVKRIDLSRFRRDAYIAELGLFGKASHTRLVPLLGHSLEREDEKLLVYKYMPNRDLSFALHRKPTSLEDTLQSLDWITRLKIAIGAAEGLTYLHQECTPSLVHRDVQASSILLDDKFEVRLGSLNNVCPQGEVQQSVIARLFRIAQTSEHGSTGVPAATCAYDVYCFGKVLLELVSGKLGISGSSDPSADAWLEWALPLISIHEKESVTKIVDPSLIVDEDLLEEVWAMSIVAKSCLNPKPSKRPLMRYILKALENPLKVVREDNVNASARSRTSSLGSWNAARFGSWRDSSSEIIAIPGSLREEHTQKGSFRQSGTEGSPGSGQGDVCMLKRVGSNEVFPEPTQRAVQTSSTGIEQTEVGESILF